MQKHICSPDAKGPIPHMGAFGSISINDSTTSVTKLVELQYFIMKRYRETLDSYMSKKDKHNDCVFNKITIIEQLVKGFEIIHRCGFTYNDLKPENIMITKASNG